MKNLMRGLSAKVSMDAKRMIDYYIAVRDESPPREGIIMHYRVGPVNYYVYRSSDGLVRLRFVEPKPIDLARLKEIVSGLSRPHSEAEQYYYNKFKSGYGPLYPLIIDTNIEEIAVEGPGRPVIVVHRAMPGRWLEVDLRLSEEEVDGLVLQLARKAGKSISIADPIVEGLTEEGYRVALTLSREVSRFGSSLVIRKYPEKPITLGDLIASRALSPLMAAYLWLLVEAGSFIIIIGSMGAGKTTLLQALADLIPPYYRVITIEDTPELKLQHPHWDSLIVRPSSLGEDLKEISLEDLLKFALRRRAEYIIVGEVRGREARLLAQAVASGHGSMTTFHADSPEAAIMRLRLDPINLPPLFLKLIDVIVHVKKVSLYGGRAIRRVKSVTEIVNDELVDVFNWDPRTDKFEPRDPKTLAESSVKLNEAWERLGVPHQDIARELGERARLLESIAGLPSDEFYKRITRFYVERGY